MKKSLALLAIATLLVSAGGCGCCRGLFGRSSVGTVGPFYGRLAPNASCGACCNNLCTDCNSCSSGTTCGCESSDCGCESGGQISYGYPGAGFEGAAFQGVGQGAGFEGAGFEGAPMGMPVEMPVADGGVIPSAPITVPAGSGTYGQ